MLFFVLGLMIFFFQEGTISMSNPSTILVYSAQKSLGGFVSLYKIGICRPALELAGAEAFTRPGVKVKDNKARSKA